MYKCSHVCVNISIIVHGLTLHRSTAVSKCTPGKIQSLAETLRDKLADVFSNSGVNQFRNSEIIGLMRENADRQTTFQLYIVDALDRPLS